uniref:EF-hand domain-containing protein n=1 Tax=Zooxanthella nutricula TaxID=1333877 RepID=A0A7S2KC24_9DINO|mmetsp:Transcript_46018/g.139527  ORF Transcript_46018/g.139527 Transcript_46018/m.139527 type:complete len:139 (+) Transcript_46018:2-418(+)
MWRALDDDCSGAITLRDWDLASYEALVEFKGWADRVHGSVVKAFRALDNASGNAKLSEGELHKALRGDDPCKADLEIVFDGLDVHSCYSLTEGDVKFLDLWDMAWESWLWDAKQKRKDEAAKRALKRIANSSPLPSRP